MVAAIVQQQTDILPSNVFAYHAEQKGGSNVPISSSFTAAVRV